MQEQQKVLAMINSQNKSFEQLWKDFLSLRNQNHKHSDLIIEIAFQLIRNHRSSLGNEYYIILEELFYAGIDVNCVELSKSAGQELQSEFENSQRVKRMSFILGDYNSGDEQYELHLKEYLTDFDARKRQVANFRNINDTKEYVENLNRYLKMNPNDAEAWMELGDLYLNKLEYQKAAFCYEEVILILPKKILYFIKLAEIYYSAGGYSNYIQAKNYYCYALFKDPSNPRALWGLLQTCHRISQGKRDEKVEKLQSVIKEQLQKLYKGQKTQQLTSKLIA